MPKVVEFDFVVPGTPERVAERLNARTVPAPLLAGPFRRPDDGKLSGVVTSKRFELSLSPRGKTCAMATGRMESVAGGTRLHGRVEVPALLVWQYRVALLFPFGIAFGAIGAGGIISWIGLALAAVFMAWVLFASGWSIHRLEQQIDPLLERVEVAAGRSGEKQSQRVPVGVTQSA